MSQILEVKNSIEWQPRVKSLGPAGSSGSGSSRPEVNSAPESSRPRVNSAQVNSAW